ncbi:MAG TPA: hypothetical protein VJQ77_03865, partial [Novosphingobium sp.]|nr:hypothetical protein [Novosphingobium sp.]
MLVAGSVADPLSDWRAGAFIAASARHRTQFNPEVRASGTTSDQLDVLSKGANALHLPGHVCAILAQYAAERSGRHIV